MAKSKSSNGEIFFCGNCVTNINFCGNYSTIRMD